MLVDPGQPLEVDVRAMARPSDEITAPDARGRELRPDALESDGKWRSAVAGGRRGFQQHEMLRCGHRFGASKRCAARGTALAPLERMRGSRRRPLFHAAFVAFALAHLAMLAGGVLYTTTERMLPYHEQALGRSWAEQTPLFQSLYLSMCRAIGIPTLIAALALLAILLMPWRRGDKWARWLLPVLSLGYSLPMLGIALHVRLETGARTPVGFLALGSALVLCATLLGALAGRGRGRHPLRTPAGATHF
jgi:hypothetical protein